MDEAYMETCLKAAFSRPMSGNLRVSAMNRESASRMLDKPLMAVLIVAAHEMEPPAADDDDAPIGLGKKYTEPLYKVTRTQSQSSTLRKEVAASMKLFRPTL